MPYKPLPASPSLTHLKNQARDLHKALKAHEPQAFQRLREFHPRFLSFSDEQIGGATLALSDAQLVVAREYCFPSWPKLKEIVATGRSEEPKLTYLERIVDPIFRQAVELLDSGDDVALKRHLKANPQVVHQRVFFSMSDYFGQPTLLEFVAENPIRKGTMQPNVVDLARVILEAGAKDDKQAINHTLGLVSSGAVPRRSRAQTGLIDLLCDYGANADMAMSSALTHGEFEAVETLIRHGALIDLAVTAAMGRTEEARKLIPVSDSSDRHRALALASQFGRLEIVKLLLYAGGDPNRFNPIGAHSHATPLHEASLNGHLEVVKLLVEHGADPETKDILFGGTALGWAEHGGQTYVADYLASLGRPLK